MKPLDYLTESFKIKVRVPDGTGSIEERKEGDVSIVLPLPAEGSPFVAVCKINGGPFWSAKIEARQMDALCRRWLKIQADRSGRCQCGYC